MPAATITTNTLLQPNYTPANFATALKLAIANAGFGPLYDETLVVHGVGHEDYRFIYEIVFDPAKANAKIYYTIGLTAGQGVYFTSVASMGSVETRVNGIYKQIYTAWNTTANTGTNYYLYQRSDNVLGEESFYDFVSINHPELHIVNIYKANVLVSSFSILRPTAKPLYWNEDNHPYYFVSTDVLIGNNFTQHTLPSISPFNSNISYSVLNFPVGGVLIPTGKRNISPGVTIVASNNNGPVGKTSADIVLAGTLGTVVGDTLEVTAGIEEYYVLNPTTGLAIRKV